MNRYMVISRLTGISIRAFDSFADAKAYCDDNNTYHKNDKLMVIII